MTILYAAVISILDPGAVPGTSTINLHIMGVNRSRQGVKGLGIRPSDACVKRVKIAKWR